MVTWINQVSVQLVEDGYLVAPGLCPAGPELCGWILPRVEGLGEKKFLILFDKNVSLQLVKLENQDWEFAHQFFERIAHFL